MPVHGIKPKPGTNSIVSKHVVEGPCNVLQLLVFITTVLFCFSKFEHTAIYFPTLRS